MIVEKESRKVLGAHLIVTHATDLIAEATLAIQQVMTAQQITLPCMLITPWQRSWGNLH